MATADPMKDVKELSEQVKLGSAALERAADWNNWDEKDVNENYVDELASSTWERYQVLKTQIQRCVVNKMIDEGENPHIDYSGSESVADVVENYDGQSISTDLPLSEAYGALKEYERSIEFASQYFDLDEYTPEEDAVFFETEKDEGEEGLSWEKIWSQ